MYKMKKIKLIIAIVVLMVLAVSCEKSLDLTPQQNLDENLALNTSANVKTVLVSAYAALRGHTATHRDACYLRNSELAGGTGEISWRGTYTSPREIYNHQIIAANSDITVQWMQSYECINICNNVLSALTVVDSADRASVEGQALFLRSLMYFDLIRFYAKTYEPGTVNSRLGVPLVLTPTHGISEGNQVGRNTVEEVYAKVITDLERAATILPEENGYYASMGAANALLARVYLQKGAYDKARDAADKVLGADLYSLTTTYAEAFNNTEYSSEDIFAIEITAADGINVMTEFWSGVDYGGRDGDIVILPAHLDVYDPADARLALFWVYDTQTNTILSGKWNNQYGLINLFRLAEMYLIRAECNQRLGTSVGATPLDDYNMIHERAGLTPATSVTLSDILLERRLELAHEGFKLHDMKRLKLNVGALLYNDPRLVFPIPDREIQANPALKGQQNEGY
jgi:tetratricopeptide (TPR) repeat protein